MWVFISAVTVYVYISVSMKNCLRPRGWGAYVLRLQAWALL